MREKSVNPEFRAAMLMLTSVILFTMNTLLVRAMVLYFPSTDSWLITFFRGMAGNAVVLIFYTRGRGLQIRHLFTRKKIILRGMIGAVGIYLFYLTIIHLGASRAIVINYFLMNIFQK